MLYSDRKKQSFKFEKNLYISVREGNKKPKKFEIRYNKQSIVNIFLFSQLLQQTFFDQKSRFTVIRTLTSKTDIFIPITPLFLF